MKYSLAMRVIHWLMALCILGLIAVGWYMTGLPKESPDRGELYMLHKSFGVLALLLFFVRVVFRLLQGAPALPDAIKAVERKLAYAGHILLYFLMLAVPLSGYIMSDAGGHGVKMFGIAMPHIFPDDKSLAGIAHELHEIIPYVFLALIVLHFLGAMKHQLVDKIPLLRRML